MEWAVDLQSRFRIHAKGEERQGQPVHGVRGLQWTSSFAFIAADGYHLDVALDGLNTAGLSLGLLWMPDTKYESASKNDTKIAIDVLDVGGWLLGTCSTVGECVDKLSEVRIVSDVLEAMGAIPTVHIALHDAHGKNAVVEFTDGEKRIFDNPNGVLTNAPTFDWHMTNLRNYLHISPNNPKPTQFHGTVLNVPGQGGGFLGIPGDWTPPSRFVRTTSLLNFAQKALDASSGIILAQHVLNAVDIPKGNVRPDENDATISDYTQWAIIKDLTNRVLYFRTYDDLNLRRFDLKDLDLLSPDEGRTISMSA